MQIVIVTRGLEFDGDSLKRGSLGGSETAVICVARELVKLGHTVRVFCECSKPGLHDGVNYSHVREYKQQCATLAIDVLIASRWAEFLVAKSHAGLRVLWCHDVLVDADQVMPGLFQTDMLMLLSDFHIDQYSSIVPELRKHCWKTSNGVDLELIEKCKRPKVKKKLIYTSRPERGLHYLLGDILPKILEKHPDAKLYCASYQNNLIAPEDPASQLAQLSEDLAAEYPNNVVPMGSLTKEQLYCHMSSAQLWLFPTQFPEISCISAMEAQACGTAVVTTDDFALRETVGPDSGIKLSGHPSDSDYAQRFVDTVNALLDDQAKIDALSAKGPEWVRTSGYSWDQVAKSWTDKFEDVLFKRWHANKERVVMELERRSDLVPAKRLAEAAGLTQAVERINHAMTCLPATAEGTVQNRFQKAIPRFRVLSRLTKLFGKKLKKILDFRASAATYGLVAAKEFPEAEVTLYSTDAEVRSCLAKSIEKAGLKNARLVEKLGADDSFDFVVADEQIDSAVSPDAYLKSLMAYLNTGGIVGFTSRYGSAAGKYEGVVPNRLWNLDQADFQRMFGAQEFHLAFHTGSVGSGGELLGHWIGCLRKTPGLHGPDVEGRKTRTRPYKTLSVCMITRNEEDWLLGCLKSIETIADRIIIADSKSTDSTVGIAKSFGAEVREIDFEDFSQARRESIKDAGTDWILWLDADERLVGTEAIRRYLQSEICEGFGIRQNHLMLDNEKSTDVPIRLFKNKPHHTFNGCIHEQPEDVSEQQFDKPIAPSLIIPDADLAHFGYINEKTRRQKVSNRNLKLLIKDIRECEGRLFTWVFVIRDYMNFVKWYKEAGNPVVDGSFAHVCLNAAVATYLSKFANTSNERLRDLARPMYQEALKWLGLAGLCYGDLKAPPFEINFTLAGAVGGLEDRRPSADFRWFLCPEEFRLFLDGKGAELQSRLFDEKTEEKSKYCYCPSTDLPDPTVLLDRGCNLFQ
jgi:glycosyltransferase involved in cell wall biosynthesis